MRIAMFTNNYKPYIGGVPISIEHLSEALRQQGHVVYVFAPTYKEQEEEEFVVRYPSFPISVAKAPVPNVLTKLFEEKVKEYEIDVIHVHHPALVGNIAIKLRKKLGIPVVFTYHTRYEAYLHYVKPLEGLERQTGWLNRYLTFFCNHCDMLIAPTPGMKSYLEEKEYEVPIGVLPTGIPKNHFLPDEKKAEKIKRKYGNDVDYLFCTVSRLAKEKNIDFQLEALRILKEKMSTYGKSFRYLMIGDGPERENVKKRVCELGLEDNIVLVGNVENAEIATYQKACDAFLFSSKSETQGIVILEAMAVGNPVVAVDGSGVRDVVKSGVNGYLVSEDVNDWANSILHLFESKEKYLTLCEGAKNTAADYTESKVAEKAANYYFQMMRNAEHRVETVWFRQTDVIRYSH